VHVSESGVEIVDTPSLSGYSALRLLETQYVSADLALRLCKCCAAVAPGGGFDVEFSVNAVPASGCSIETVNAFGVQSISADLLFRVCDHNA